MTNLCALCCILLSLPGHVTGSTYAVAMIGLEIQTGGASPYTYEVVLLNTGTNQITVQREDISIQGLPSSIIVPPQDTQNFTIPTQNVMNGSEIANKTIIFTSTDDFTLQIFSKSDAHTEGLLGIPLENLAGPHQIDNVYEYVVTTFCATSGFCQLAVTSNQHVDIKVSLPGHVNDVVFCIGMRYFRSWRNTLIALDKFDALQIESTRDLTGTHIYSMAPIVVYVGSRNVTAGGVVTHMLEQLTPASHWGTKFGVTTLSDNSYGDVLKIAATWSGTLVHIQGFPSFKISNRSHVVSKRLDKNMVSYIEASHPIQVIQITGLTYATNETGAVAMTTVPAVEHAFNATAITCGPTATEGLFTILTGKGADTPKVSNIDVSTKASIPYWNQAIYNVSLSSETFTVEGSSVFGIVKCDGKSVFPLATMNINTQTVNEQTVNTEETCIEGETIFTTYEYGGSPSTVIRRFNGMEVLKIRAMVCGEAVIHLDQGSNSIVIRLSEKTTYVDLCHGDICKNQEASDDSYNVDLDCTKDMFVYWLKQKAENETSILFCFGTGPNHDKSDDCSGSSLFHSHFNTDSGSLFDTFSLVGIHSNAFFLVDLEKNSGCSVRVSDWRCEDKLQNCSSYDKSICNSTDQNYDVFITDACKKHCGQCEVDSYGKKFLVPFPYFRDLPADYSCTLYVTGTNSSASVYVSAITGATVLKTLDLYDNRTYEYDCTDHRNNLVIVRSNEDVAVTAFHWVNGKILSHNVYPVDVFGMEYMSFAHESSSRSHCKLVSEADNVDVLAYFTNQLQVDFSSTIDDGDTFTMSSEFTLIAHPSNNALKSGVQFLPSKPIGVFCGNFILNADSSEYPDNFNQMLPTEVWGTTHRIPAMGDTAVNRPYDGEIRIQGYRANTFVTISGDFNSNYSLTSIGQVESVVINIGSSYLIQSNYPVAVALYLNDATDTSGKFASFHIIPPVTSYSTNPLVFVPLEALSNRFTTLGTVSSMSLYFISNDGTWTNVTGNDVTVDIYTWEASGSVFGMTSVLTSDSKWFTVPGYISAVPLIDSEPTCVISTTVPGDNVDNDCDKLVDEDICYSGYGVYGNDFDIDGDFNEDCQSMVTGPVDVARDPEPVCLVIDKPADQCWTVCECKCSWVLNYELMQNMTTEEVNALLEERNKVVTAVLKVNTDTLSSSEAKFVSADDERQSAANIGYVGIALFTIVFGTIFVMDISALLRDIRTFCRNWKHGVRRFWNFIRCKR